MKISDVQKFFMELDRRIKTPLRVVLTGGAAAVLQGVKRATHDIDFELTLKRPRRAGPAESWDAIEKAIEETGRVTGVVPQYAEDIDRWSAITLPSKNSTRYRQIGKVEVRILSPDLWAIGKLTRYLSSDIGDLRTVLK